MPFSFNLAAVLRLREIIEAREERALTDILAEIAKVHGTIGEIDAARLALRADAEQDLRGAMNAAELQSRFRRGDDLKAARLGCEQQLAKLEERRLQQMAIYQAAHRSRKMLTEMRAEQRTAYELERERRDQKVADDIFLARRTREQNARPAAARQTLPKDDPAGLAQ